ncbi:MAG TPA: hypothetical protein VFC34_03615, partial [Puia sp.]|nr:hypothetical protein [Puia sp.]
MTRPSKWNSCFFAALNKIVTGGFKSQLTSIFLNTFENSTQLDVIVGQKPYIGGAAEAAHTFSTISGDYFKAQIWISSTVLANASQEFVSETIFHESIHAYLDATGTESAVVEHIAMLTGWVDCELAALQGEYNSLSLHDALCLILGGFGDTDYLDPTMYN